MNNTSESNINNETINKLGLRISEKKINSEINTHARIFEFPELENVFIMENDLYGNVMPKGTCFLAYYGNHGLIGKHLKVETLVNASVSDIRNMVQSNIDG
ncbi:MAG: hypothetical protein ACXWV9_02595 [Flavisolibacter sp.]